ncbi:MAG: hypothetical protein FWG25_06550 [Promicromonosporaceae bacterium]|nr:hypothetical protein [Promicromonosporaceae bacterium]
MTGKVGAKGAHNAGKALEDRQEHPREVGVKGAHNAAKALDARKDEK